MAKDLEAKIREREEKKANAKRVEPSVVQKSPTVKLFSMNVNSNELEKFKKINKAKSVSCTSVLNLYIQQYNKDNEEFL